MGFLTKLTGGITGAIGGFVTGGPVGAIIGGTTGLLGDRENRKASDKARRAERRATGQARANLGKATEFQLGATDASTNFQLDALNSASGIDRRALRKGTRLQLGGVEDAVRWRANTGARQSEFAEEERGRTAGAYAPQLGVGREALGRLSHLSGGGTPEEQAAAREAFKTSPGYQFRQAEGEKGIRRLAAANKTMGSGAMYKDLLKYNQGLATDEYGNYVGQLQGLARYLPDAARGTATSAASYGSQRRSIVGGLGSDMAGYAARIAQLKANEVSGTAGSRADEIRSRANLESNRALDVADLEANRLAGETNLITNAAASKARRARETGARREAQINQLGGILQQGAGSLSGFFGGGGAPSPAANPAALAYNYQPQLQGYA